MACTTAPILCEHFDKNVDNLWITYGKTNNKPSFFNIIQEPHKMGGKNTFYSNT